jgi:hypothetical protein
MTTSGPVAVSNPGLSALEHRIGEIADLLSARPDAVFTLEEVEEAAARFAGEDPATLERSLGATTAQTRRAIEELRTSLTSYAPLAPSGRVGFSLRGRAKATALQPRFVPALLAGNGAVLLLLNGVWEETPVAVGIPGPALPRYRLRLSAPLVVDNVLRGAMSPHVFVYADGVPEGQLGRKVEVPLGGQLRFLASETDGRTPYLVGSPVLPPPGTGP